MVFYCLRAKLVIELDGSQRFEASGRQADIVWDQALWKPGLTVLRYANWYINRNFEGVCADILERIQPFLGSGPLGSQNIKSEGKN